MREHLGQSLFKNAYYLMTSSVLSSAVGYIYWIIAVRLFLPQSVGVAAAVLSTSGLIVGIADMGLGVATIRFLPEAGSSARDLVNSVISLTVLVSASLSGLFLVASPFIAPQFTLVAHSPSFAAIFISAAVIQSLVYTLGSLFMARRASKYSFYQDTSASVIKLIFIIPIAFLFSDARGLVCATVWGLALSAIYALLFLLPKSEPGFRFIPRISFPTLRPMVRYAFGNYVGRVFLEAHTLIVPLIVLNLLGAAANAIYYMAWATSLIFRVIPTATFNSLFAEGSNDAKSMSLLVRKAVWMTAALLTPASLLMILGADYFLLILGKHYAAAGANTLRVLVLANFPWAVNYLAISIARIRKDNQTVSLVSMGLFAAVIASFFLFVPIWGGVGGGIAYFVGQSVVATAVVIVFCARRWLSRRRIARATPSSSILLSQRRDPANEN